MTNTINSKRFVIRKSLIGKNTTINVEFKNGKSCTYNHDKVYEISVSIKSEYEMINNDDNSGVAQYLGCISSPSDKPHSLEIGLEERFRVASKNSQYLF